MQREAAPRGIGIWNMGLGFGDEAPAVDAAIAAEQLGFTAVWLPDLGGGGLFERLEALLAATKRIVVATGILNIWMHEPRTVAEQVARLNGSYGDRLLLGLGVSHAPIIDAVQEGKYRAPLSHMHQFLDDLDAASPPVTSEARVLAALGPKMLGLARDRAFGAHPYLVSLEHVGVARRALGPDAYLAPEVAVVLETDPALARQMARNGLEMYFGLPNYMNNLARFGFDAQDLAAPGSDRLIDALVIWGDEQEICSRIDQFRAAGADHVSIQVLTGAGTADPVFPVEQWRRLAPVLV